MKEFPKRDGISREAAENAGRKAWKIGRPGEIYQNQETPGDIGKLDRSGIITNFWKHWPCQ